MMALTVRCRCAEDECVCITSLEYVRSEVIDGRNEYFPDPEWNQLCPNCGHGAAHHRPVEWESWSKPKTLEEHVAAVSEFSGPDQIFLIEIGISAT